MKLPTNLVEITVRQPSRPGAYPPLGLLPISGYELGNGDYYSLYWPITRESADPIVAEVQHDDGRFQPSFSSLHAFLSCTKNSGDSWVDAPTIDQDPTSPYALVKAARGHIANQDTHAAIRALEKAIASVPEYGEALSLITFQLSRIANMRDAISAAIHSIISPPSLGGTNPKVLQWLARQPDHAFDLTHDPIWIHRKTLKLKFGGVKTNDDYKILRESIDVYASQGNSFSAIALTQTYGELMDHETTSFQERYNYSASEYMKWQIESARAIGIDRLPSADP